MKSQMSNCRRLLVAGLLMGWCLLLPTAIRADSCEPCGEQRLGTAVPWVAQPDRALQLAREQDKLVFVIQVSGNFALSEFT